MIRSRELIIQIQCAGVMLPGILHDAATPAGHRRTGVLVIVGGPQYRVGSHRQFVLMARALATGGVPVLRFDYRGMGDAAGELRTFEGVAEDIAAAMDAWSRADPSIDGFVLWGLCDGASAAMMNCAHDRVAGLVLVNPWARSTATEAKALVTHYYVSRFFSLSFWRKLLSGNVSVGAAIKGLLERLKVVLRGEDQIKPSGDFRQRMLSGMKSFNGRVLVLLSGRDLTAREFEDMVASSADWKQVLARPTVSLARLEDADHTFSSRTHLDRVSALTTEWVAKSFRSR